MNMTPINPSKIGLINQLIINQIKMPLNLYSLLAQSPFSHGFVSEAATLHFPRYIPQHQRQSSRPSAPKRPPAPYLPPYGRFEAPHCASAMAGGNIDRIEGYE